MSVDVLDLVLDRVSAIVRKAAEKQQIQQTRSNVEPTEVFEIPEDKCGLVIGKGGSKIQEIRSTAGVDVNLGDRDSAVNGMMKVYLWGDKEGCDEAKKIIVDIISEPSVVFEIPEDKCGVVIGKRGSKMKEIRSETGVRVNVGSRDSVNGMIKVTLKGDKQDCDEAKNIILDLISEQTEVFEIPKDRSGQVIGERGSKVKEIESKTGVRVNVRSSKAAVNGMIKVTLRGNKEGWDEAKNIINELISEPIEVFKIPEYMIGVVKESKIQEIQSETGVEAILESRDSAVCGMVKVTLMGNKEGCEEAKRIIMELIPEPTEVFEIPDDMVGVVIGKGGSKVREIKSETGVRVSVGSRHSAVDGMIEVRLWGNKHECTEVESIIMELISKTYQYRLDRLKYEEDNAEYVLHGHDIDPYLGYCYEEF